MRWLDQFLRDDKGSATIEFVLWVPVVLVLVAIVVDATTIYVTHTEMWNVARNTARQMTTGVIATEEDALLCAYNEIELRSDLPYDVEAIHDPDADQATVIIRLSLNDTTITEAGSILYQPLKILGVVLQARVVMRMDPYSVFGKVASSADCAKAPDDGDKKKGPKTV